MANWRDRSRRKQRRVTLRARLRRAGRLLYRRSRTAPDAAAGAKASSLRSMRLQGCCRGAWWKGAGGGGHLAGRCTFAQPQPLLPSAAAAAWQRCSNMQGRTLRGERVLRHPPLSPLCMCATLSFALHYRLLPTLLVSLFQSRRLVRRHLVVLLPILFPICRPHSCFAAVAAAAAAASIRTIRLNTARSHPLLLRQTPASPPQLPLPPQGAQSGRWAGPHAARRRRPSRRPQKSGAP